jgi:hypothetical protein
MSIVQSPMWQQVKPYCRGTLKDDGNMRLEITSCPADLANQMLLFETPCPACSAAYHPFRAREYTAAKERGGAAAASIFFKVSCDDKRCSRGRAARDAMTAVRLDLGVGESKTLKQRYLELQEKYDKLDQEHMALLETLTAPASCG